MLQFNASPLLLLILAVGAVVFNVVVAEAVAVQPLLPVTVTVYVPALFTLMAAVEAPVLHA